MASTYGRTPEELEMLRILEQQQQQQNAQTNANAARVNSPAQGTELGERLAAPAQQPSAQQVATPTLNGNAFAPAFQGSYDRELQEIYNKIVNREPFKYDLNGDALYQQYKDQYIGQGKLAMQDTIGKAAQLTGGYGNSYAATAGNQAYNDYLQKLNNVVPELYDRAYRQYADEGNALMSRFSAASDLGADEYARYTDERDYNANMGAMQRDNAYTQAMTIITLGKMPTADLLRAAGISDADAAAMVSAYKRGSSGKKPPAPTPTTELTEEEIAALTKNGGNALNAALTGFNAATAGKGKITNYNQLGSTAQQIADNLGKASNYTSSMEFKSDTATAIERAYDDKRITKQEANYLLDLIDPPKAQ